VQTRKSRIIDQSGVLIVVTAVSLTMILGMAGLALDLGYMYIVKTELQRAADAGAMAGARALFFPRVTSPPQCAAAQSKAWEIAQANLADGSPPTVSTPPEYAAPYGHWNWSTRTFTPGCSSSSGNYTNAVTIRAAKSNISLLFMGVFGYGPRTLTAAALASMDFVGRLEEGASFAMVLNRSSVKTAPAVTYIYLAPDPPGNGGWYAKAPTNPTSALMQYYLNNPSMVPDIEVDDRVRLANGAWSAPLNIIRDNYMGKTVLMPVVETVKFNQDVPVLGFTAFQITGVSTTGHRYVRGLALQLWEVSAASSQPGGANDFGLLSATRLSLSD